MEPEQAVAWLPKSSSPAEPPSTGGTHLTGHLSRACPLQAGCSYLPRRAVGGLGAPGSAEGRALRVSQVLCFFLSPQFLWWQLAPAPPAPGGLSDVPTESSGGGGFNCPGDASLSGNLIFVDLYFALEAWRDVCPSLALTSGCMGRNVAWG